MSLGRTKPGGRPGQPRRRSHWKWVVLAVAAAVFLCLTGAIPVRKWGMRVAAWIPGVGSSVTIRVVDEGGRPIEDATVRWCDKALVGGREEENSYESTTGADGECTLRFLQGVYLVSVRKPGYHPPDRKAEHAAFDRSSDSLAAHTVKLYKQDPPALMAVTPIEHEWKDGEPLALGLRMVDTG